MNLRVVTHPEAEPVSTLLAMQHCKCEELYGRSPVDPEQTYVEALITAARQHAELFTGRALALATYELRLDDFADFMPLRGPVREIESIQYVDVDGELQELGVDVYVLDDDPDAPGVRLAYGESWPTVRSEKNAVRIRFVAGYTDESPADPLPKPIVLAILLMVCHLYENRQDVTDRQQYEMPRGSETYLRPFRTSVGL